MTYSFAPNDQPLYVREGDYVQFKFKAPPTWDTTLTVTVQIGALTQFWSIITIPEDFTPDPFPFESVVDADLDTLYTYADGQRPSESVITVTGLTNTTQAGVNISTNLAVPDGVDESLWYAMRIDYDGDGNWDTDWLTGDTTYYVENGAKIQIRGRTKNVSNQRTKITLRIGTSFEAWEIITKPVPVNQPIPFPVFTDLENQQLNIYCYSEVLPISGLFDPGLITMGGDGEYAVSSTGNTSTDDNGFEVLDGAVWASSGTLNNGDYIQLRILSAADGNVPKATSYTIADAPIGATWTVTTGNIPSTTPNSFSFPTVTNVNTSTLVSSAARPAGGITGLGDGVTVPVTVVNTDSNEVKIKINDRSIGVFPATVTNGDVITLYLESSPDLSDYRELQIKVGNLTLSPWLVETYSGPDGDPDDLIPPADKTNQIPGRYVTSAPVTITGINIPVEITSSNVFSLISIDYDEAVAGPRTFDPAVNTSFRIVLLSAINLNTPESTVVTVGSGGTANNPFTWTVTTYALVPPPATNLGVWYSKKTNKFDGYTVGTVLPILKETFGDYGDLSGTLASRYPGFRECNGDSVAAADYWTLFEMIGNTYGGDGKREDVIEIIDNKQVTKPVYSGNFNLPDYRNRRLCGTGIVDSARGNSAFLTPRNGKTNIDPGGEGGYWYFDKVDPFTPDYSPGEQIRGPEGTTDGLNSQFYSLGTIRISGTDTLVESVPFTITGSVSGIVGPLQVVVVTTPEHEHNYFAAVAESDSGFPLIAWGNADNGRGMFRTGAGGQAGGDFQQLNEGPLDPGGTADDNPSLNREIVLDGLEDVLDRGNFTAGNANFTQALQAYYGDDWEGTRDWLENKTSFSYTMTGEGDGNIDDFDDNPISLFQAEFYTWWLSDVSQLDGANLANVGGGGGGFAAVIDIRPTTFTIDSFLPESGGVTLGHSHRITLDPITDFQTDYTQGNSSDSGAIGSGLGNGQDSKTVTFTQSDLFMDMTEGEFTFSRSFLQPIPDVTMRPQRQAPIINPFHKAKYIIKVY